MCRRKMLFCALFPMLSSLCAAGPPPQGVETQMGAGSGSFEYQSGGCGTPLYANKATAIDTYAKVSYRHSTGLSGAVDASASLARTTDSRLIDPGEEENPPLQDEAELGSVNLLVAVAPRIGYHHRYFGVEAGGFLVDDLEAGFGPALLPSGTAWVGLPEVVYVWGSFLEGPTSIAHLPIEAGLGHSSKRVRAALGVGWEPSLVAAGSYQLTEQVPVFLGARVTQLLPADHRGTLGAITLAYTW